MKYLQNTLVCTDWHFLLQANEVGSSNKMELEGAKRSFEAIKGKDMLPIKTFVSDRHRCLAKWMRITQADTTHYYDIWHQAKSVVKKVLKAGKEKGCEILTEWSKSIRNHLYWCATSTKAGFPSLIEAKWLSFMRHVNNEHKEYPNALYDKCHHGEISETKKWIKVGKCKEITVQDRFFSINDPFRW